VAFRQPLDGLQSGLKDPSPDAVFLHQAKHRDHNRWSLFGHFAAVRAGRNGNDNVMFSVDYPFEKTDIAARFIDNAQVPETDRMNVAFANAKRILRLDQRKRVS
jgi:hypothetical protein